MKWYFQFTPHDVWDWDANETLVLADANWKGKPRKLMFQANRNGFYYVLDRVTGEFLHASPFVDRLDWAKGIDAKGRPILVPGKEPTAGGSKVCPSVRGASNWMSPSYNPETGLFYLVSLEQCDIYTTSAKEPVPSTGFRGTANRGGEEFWYDGSNQRVATVKLDKHARKTGMIWWLDDAEAHYDAAGAIEKVYSHLSLGTPMARVTRTANASVSVELQFHGLANNTLAAVDGNTGATNAAFVYAPFGELVEAVDAGGAVGTAAHRRRMNDKFVDEISDLGYYGFRYYDKTSMAWTQSDPLYRHKPDAAGDQPRRGSLYAMCVSNPLYYLDPDGRGVTLAAGAELGATVGAPAGPLGSVAGAIIGGALGFAASVLIGDAIVRPIPIPIAVEPTGPTLDIAPEPEPTGITVSPPIQVTKSESAPPIQAAPWWWPKRSPPPAPDNEHPERGRTDEHGRPIPDPPPARSLPPRPKHWPKWLLSLAGPRSTRRASLRLMPTAMAS
jgi:RHS repeat-associated protein